MLKYVVLLGDEFDVPSAVEIWIENKYNIWYIRNQGINFDEPKLFI